jgi:NADH-quinone oxidoreductase subunit N
MAPLVQDFYRMAPELMAAGFGLLIMLVDPFLSRERKGVLARIALLGSMAALCANVLSADYSGVGFYGLFVVDAFSVFLRILIFGVLPLVILGSYDYLNREHIQHGEYYALLLFATCGMGVMAGANELVTAFIGLEISSISSYILACYRRDVMKSNESAMKYFLLGSFATAFFLYGVAMIYGATRTTSIELLRTAVPNSPEAGLLLTIGFALMFVGLGFKIAVAPFQVWTPDVYEGAPTPVTALLSSAPKAAAFAILLRVFFTAFGSQSDFWFWIVWASAALTMIIGNFAALAQSSVKRMLAYSSIAHAGYLLVAIAARNELGIAAVLFYLVAYAFMKIGAFTIVSHLGGTGEQKLEIEDYAGLAVRQPGTAASLSLFLLSLLGLPLTAGFVGKFYIFKAALDARLIWLVVLMALVSVVGAFYYLRVIWVMYFRAPQGEWSIGPMPVSVAGVVLIAAAGTLLMFFFPGAVMLFAQQSALAIK